MGTICSLTNKIADFEGTCVNFKHDTSVIESTAIEKEISNEEIIIKLDENAINKLKNHQDFIYALIAGSLATFLSAIIWAIITLATKFQIGYMAIGVGIVVGYSVQFFGAGIDKKYGYLGAALSLFGCIFGNLFIQVGLIAQEQSFGYFETLTYLNFSLIISILIESFNPMDILFYGLAIYAGYRFAFRRLSNELLLKLKSKDFDGRPSNQRFRTPLIMVSFVILLFLIVKINEGVSGLKTYKYESGKKMSEGELMKSKEHGKWTYYYENGNIQLIGYYNNGFPDSLWQWYNETGQLKKIGNYKKGLEHGVWINYYNNGILSDSGSFYEGRMHGKWIYKYENGGLLQSGFFNRNAQDSIWKSYYTNGQLSSNGNMKEGKPFGNWITYFENGQLFEEIDYSDKISIKNAWDINGNQLVVNGNGIYKSFSPTGQVLLTGEVRDGIKVGKWKIFYENGKIKEEGEFLNDMYLLMNSWDINENQIVKNGFGNYNSYYKDGVSVFETGEIKDGLRNGLWKVHYESNGNTIEELQYVNGMLTGLQKYFFESGQAYSEGEMVNNMRTGEWKWYYENGIVSSTVKFNNDKKEGKQIMWSETGEKSKEEFYKNGELVEEKVF